MPKENTATSAIRFGIGFNILSLAVLLVSRRQRLRPVFLNPKVEPAVPLVTVRWFDKIKASAAHNI
eukprot:1344201-Amorphochlora_amoeboformis.AAC.1